MPRLRLYNLRALYRRPHTSLVIVFVFLVSVSCEPHPHQGVVKPFVSGDPGVHLSKSALNVLASGKPFTTQIEDGSIGRGLCVQDVEAPVATVWTKILDFNNYKSMVPKTVDSSVYKRQTLRGGKQRIWARLKVGFPLLKLQFYINHLYDPHNNSLTWTLDYDKKSDLDDSAGYWYVIPHPKDPQFKTRVFYSVQVSMFSWVPQFAVDFMSKQALTDATAWLKKHSEAQAAQTLGTTQVSDTGQTSRESKSRGLFGLFRKNHQETEALSESSVEVDSSRQIKPIGATRYALVFSVCALSMYNIHLYLSYS